jgi:hypothetical protein
MVMVVCVGTATAHHAARTHRLLAAFGCRRQAHVRHMCMRFEHMRFDRWHSRTCWHMENEARSKREHLQIADSHMLRVDHCNAQQVLGADKSS